MYSDDDDDDADDDAADSAVDVDVDVASSEEALDAPPKNAESDRCDFAFLDCPDDGDVGAGARRFDIMDTGKYDDDAHLKAMVRWARMRKEKILLGALILRDARCDAQHHKRLSLVFGEGLGKLWR